MKVNANAQKSGDSIRNINGWVLARNLENFHLSWESESDSLKLHYKRSLGTWAAQLCSGVRGDSTYTTKTWLMDRLLVSDCLSLMLADYAYQYEQTLLFVCSEPCCEIHGVKTSSSLWLLPRGARSTRAHWQPSKYAKQILETWLFETFVQSDEGTWTDQQRMPNTKSKTMKKTVTKTKTTTMKKQLRVGLYEGGTSNLTWQSKRLWQILR